jgi:uncharacterized membrane protein YfcA
MTIQTILILIITGIAAGILGGLVGVGGGIIIVPSLVYFLSFSQKSAQGTSLGLLLLPVGIFGVLQYYKQGHVDLRVVAIIAIGFLAGSYFGSKIALSLPQETVKKIFAIMLLLIAFQMLFIDKKVKETAVKNEKKNSESTNAYGQHKPDINRLS